ncbi:LysE family transporter, partial [Deinococcus sp. MIMF12]
MDSAALSFAVFSLLLTVTPGADTALVTRAALAGGRPAGFGAVLGVTSGLLVHAALSALGLSVLLARSAALYEAVRL